METVCTWKKINTLFHFLILCLWQSSNWRSGILVVLIYTDSIAQYWHFKWAKQKSCSRNAGVSPRASCASLTQRVGGRALEDESVGGEEDGALGRQQRWASHQPRGLLAAVGHQVYAHGVHHQLLTRQQEWPKQLGLRTHTCLEEKRDRGGVTEGTTFLF